MRRVLSKVNSDSRQVDPIADIDPHHVVDHAIDPVGERLDVLLVRKVMDADLFRGPFGRHSLPENDWSRSAFSRWPAGPAFR